MSILQDPGAEGEARRMTTTTRSRNQRLAGCAVATFQAEQPATLRQLFYRLVSAGELVNDPKQYKRLGRLMTRLREAAEVPRRWIVDHVRRLGFRNSKRPTAHARPHSVWGLADAGAATARLAALQID